MILRFVDRYLDPSETLLEVLFGLTMALTITVGARLLSERADIVGVELAVALLGCNVAWGVIDGAFYRLGTIFNRNRRMRSAACRRPRTTPRPAVAVFQHADTTRPGHGDDYVAAALIAVLVAITAIPGLIPLLIFQDSFLTLRVANGLQVGLLFFTGYWWARYSGGNRWLAGFGVALHVAGPAGGAAWWLA